MWTQLLVSWWFFVLVFFLFCFLFFCFFIAQNVHLLQHVWTDIPVNPFPSEFLFFCPCTEERGRSKILKDGYQLD